MTTSPLPPPTSKFITGDRVYANVKNLNVRSTPNGKRLGAQKLNAKGTVLAGPVVSSGYTWYNVDFDIAPDGWTVETYLSKVP